MSEQQQQQQQPLLPPKEVASSYIKQKPVASTLDLLITELLVKQPNDPENHLFDFLAKRRGFTPQNGNSSSSSSGNVVVSSSHPVPPMTKHAKESSSSSQNIAAGTTTGSEELLQWILDTCGASAVMTSPDDSTGSNKSVASSSSSSAGTQKRRRSLHEQLQLPSGVAQHPLAIRALQLATRYVVTNQQISSTTEKNSSASDILTGVLPADSVAAIAIKEETSNYNNNALANTPAKTSSYVGELDGTSAVTAMQRETSKEQQEQAEISSPIWKEEHEQEQSSAQKYQQQSQQRQSGGTPASPGVLSPAVMSQLKTSFNLTDTDQGHLILAVTDAMQIILEWAGDPLLVAENLAGVVKLLVHADRCTVFVADERAQTLKTVIDSKPITMKFGEGIVGRCAMEKQALVVNNAYSHPSFNPSVDGETRYVTRNLLSMPMVVEGQLICVVQMVNKFDGDFTDMDVEIFKAFTMVAGIVVRDAMTFPLTLRNMELAEATKDLCRTLMNANMFSEKEAAATWTGQLRNFLGTDCCSMLKVCCYERPSSKHNANNSPKSSSSPPLSPTNSPSAASPTTRKIRPHQLELTFLACDSVVDFGGFQPLPQKEIIAAALATKMPDLVNNAKKDSRFDQASNRILSGIETTSILVVPVFPFTEQESCEGKRMFIAYILQFENFRDVQTSMSGQMSSSGGNVIDNSNNNDGKQQQQLKRRDSDRSQDGSSGLGMGQQQGTSRPLTPGASSSLFSNDVIFSEEAIDHIDRVLPFFESVVRQSSLIQAQKQVSTLFGETARTVSTVCEDRLDFSELFDLLSKTAEHLVQKDKIGSVLFYTKYDGEGIDMLHLLPRLSLMQPTRGSGNLGGGTSVLSSASSNFTGGSSSASGAAVPVGVPSVPGVTTVRSHSHFAHSHSGTQQQQPPQRLRKRRSSAALHVSSQTGTENIRIAIGTGVVGTAVGKNTNAATYFSPDETNELYAEGEFGSLVDSDLPNCGVVVIPLTDGQTLLGAIAILKPREEILERLVTNVDLALSQSSGSGAHSQHGHRHGQQQHGHQVLSGVTHSSHHQHVFGIFSSQSMANYAQPVSTNNNNNNVAASVLNVDNVEVLSESSPDASPKNIPISASASSSSQQQQSHISPIQLDDLHWNSINPQTLLQAGRVDFLSVLISISKYIFKASNTITALARQQEGLIWAGELERKVMESDQGTGYGSSSNLLNRPGSSGTVAGTSSTGDATTSSNAVGAGAGDSGNNNARMVNASTLNQFNFGGTHTASPLDVALRPEMFDLLTTTSFPIFEFVDGDQPATGLVALGVHMFRSLNCMADLNIDEATLSQLLIKAFRRYRNVPYHNVFHAFDVTQSTFLFMKLAKFDEYLTPAERFALLLSAVFHDIDHNGLNNAYHMKAETAFGMIASLSGQKSVLEYHHCQVAIDVINSSGVFRKTNEEDRRRILKVFFQCIMATDMALHREIMQQIQTWFLTSSSGGGDSENNNASDIPQKSFDNTNQEHRDLAMKMILKMADISNPVKDFALARRWALSVTEEFYRQGDVERSEGHEVAPMFDRQLNAELSKGQIGFIAFMARPFFSLVAQCFSEYEALTKNMENNLERWQKVQESNQPHHEGAVREL